jgi:UDP-2-acetamido-3-amino-2,3-dideoxy-glucuronate N-acetyltransferase
VKTKAYIHPMALAESRDIGRGTRVWAFTHILPGARVGQNCNIGDHCFIESGAVVGNNVTLKNGNMVWEGVTLAEGVFVGPHVFFTNDRHPRSPRLAQVQRRYAEKQNWLVPTTIERGAALGAGAVILPGVKVGEYAMVGAGAVVTKSVSSHALVIGNPARRVGWVCRCGKPLRLQRKVATCRECGCHFKLMKEGLRADRER